MYNIIFPDFLFLTIRSGGVGRRCLRRCIRRRRRRGRSLLVVHPTRRLLRAAPNGKSPVVCQNEAMEVWRPVNPLASPCPLKQAQLTTRRRPKSPPTRHRRHGNAGPASSGLPIAVTLAAAADPSLAIIFTRVCSLRPPLQHVRRYQPRGVCRRRCSLSLIFNLNFYLLRHYPSIAYHHRHRNHSLSYNGRPEKRSWRTGSFNRYSNMQKTRGETYCGKRSKYYN